MADAQAFVAGILRDAREEAARIDERTETEVTRLREETARVEQRRRENAETQVRAREALLLEQASARQRMTVSRATLACKQELLDGLFAAANAQLRRLPRESRRRLLMKAWGGVERKMTVGEIIVARQDAAFFKRKGVTIETRGGLGGFIAISKDGRVRIDRRFETLLDQVRAESTAQIAKELFRETTRARTMPLKKKIVKRNIHPSRIKRKARTRGKTRRR
jgi:vacuolar-type H+-ATPase subunit E/Vma4